MSATNHTSTIELSQYISTDKPTYLTDYNGDMLKIDNAIAADRDSIATAQQTANTADGKADINKTSIDSLNVQLNGDPDDPTDIGIAGDLNAVEGTVNTVTSLIGTGSPTTSEQTIIGAINGLEGAIAPREDGATLANSYSIGDQFARGGSVYEALTSLTAGAAFASLVLNTDYKVADTLVEQIANAGGSVLPNGYYYKSFNNVITAVKDGSKTNSQLIIEATQALLAAAQALADDEKIIVTCLSSNGTYVKPQDASQYILDNNTSNIFTIMGIKGNVGASSVSFGFLWFSTQAGYVAVRSADIQSGSVSINSDASTTALTDTLIYYDVIKAF